ncbi:MAG: DUF3379 family protein [Hydrogenovibrio sp.]|nr:DUF3379 family protein [Hydrogenovibrio sp.]
MSLELDELSFRQRLLQNPMTLDDEMKRYLEKHPEKLETVKKIKAFEDRLVEVMQIEVPEGLQDRIILKNGFEPLEASASTGRNPSEMNASDLSESAFSRSDGWWNRLAMFAASFLVVLIGGWLWFQPLAVDPTTAVQQEALHMESAVVDHIIAHAKEQPEIMAKDGPELTDKELHKVFKYVGATLNKPIDFMSYAGGCEVDGQKGLHIVLQEEEGPVTIIVLPHRQLGVMYSFNQKGFKGQIIPVKGAVVAIVGQTDKQLAMAQMHFFKSVTFG